MMKNIIKVLRAKLINILAFFACFAIITFVFYLYDIELDAIVYAFLLCFFVLAAMFCYKYFYYYRRYKQIENLQKEVIILQKDSLPETVDILEQKYQDVLRQMDKEKNKAASEFDQKLTDIEDYYTMWAHQIKTPISAMRLLLQTNESSINRELELELFRIEQYVNMVLSYLMLESDTNDFVIKSYKLDDIIKQSVKKFSKQFILKKLSLEYNGTDISILTDEKWICFVIEQIITNALKYTSSGKISIYTENDVLYIKDTGMGIAAEDLPRVFEKGYTGYNGRIDKKSTGLGLYLCKRITKKLNHGLTIESEVGVGTTVKIDFTRLPITIND